MRCDSRGQGALRVKETLRAGHGCGTMRKMDTHAAFDAPFSLEALLRQLQVTRSLQVGADPRHEARLAGPEVSYGLPHRGERRRWSYHS